MSIKSSLSREAGKKKHLVRWFLVKNGGAGEETLTLDLFLGKEAL